MKMKLIHHHHRVKAPSNLDQINIEPLKVHLNPYLKGRHHKPNVLWGHPKYPPTQSNKVAQAIYNRKQGPNPLLTKKQLDYRRNPYPHLSRFKKLVKLNKAKSHGSSKYDYNDYNDDREFDKDFESEKTRKHPIFGLSSLDQLPSIDFRSLAPVYVKNVDYETFYKLNPYFHLPLPQYNSK